MEVEDLKNSAFVERREAGKGYVIRGTRETVRAGRVAPNPWNPNEMTASEKQSLQEAIRTHGFMQEVLVRPHPDQESRDSGLEFQTIDGFHRSDAVMALAELDPAAKIDVRIIDADDFEAQKLTLVMNTNRGTHDRIREATVVKGLYGHYGDDLWIGLPWSQDEGREKVKMADTDWGNYRGQWSDENDQRRNTPEGEGWVRLEVVLTEQDHRALADARSRIEEVSPTQGDEPVRMGQVIAALAAEYLGG